MTRTSSGRSASSSEKATLSPSGLRGLNSTPGSNCASPCVSATCRRSRPAAAPCRRRGRAVRAGAAAAAAGRRGGARAAAPCSLVAADVRSCAMRVGAGRARSRGCTATRRREDVRSHRGSCDLSGFEDLVAVAGRRRRDAGLAARGSARGVARRVDERVASDAPTPPRDRRSRAPTQRQRAHDEDARADHGARPS